MAQPGGDMTSSRLCRRPHLPVELGINRHKEVPDGTLGMIAVDDARLFTPEPSSHDLPQDRSP
jgi:hypothetical protein